jgi:hypothetical protein
MWQQDGRWIGALEGRDRPIRALRREDCIQRLRAAAGLDEALIVEVLPGLAGVAEAAAIMEWDKRRVITYASRGSFPQPVATLASGRVWRRADVESYASAWRARRAGRTMRPAGS